MDERELPSDSEESDEDYVPSGEENKLSEEESDGEQEEGKEAGSDGEGASMEPTNDKSRKRQKTKSKKSKSSKRARVESPVEETPSVEEEAETEEEKKKKADAIWAAFKTETSSTAKPSTITSSGEEKNESEDKKPSEEIKEKVEEKPEKPVTITKVFEFAGEKVEVTEEVKPSVSKLPILGKASTAQRGRAQGLGILGKGGAGIPSRAGAGLAGVLGNLGKKNKLSVLEKSKLDWEGFKKKEGIDEEIQTHNRGKQGYLEKQDFLQRADVRQFELEKQMRTTVRRSNR